MLRKTRLESNRFREMGGTIFLLGLCVFCCRTAYAAPVDYSTKSTAALIDDLAAIDSPAPGLDGGSLYDGFIADDHPLSFEGGVLGIPLPTVPPQMRELVRRGPLALPELLKHLDDARPTKLQVGSKDSKSLSGQIGVDAFMGTFFSDEYDPRRGKRHPGRMDKVFEGRYTVKIGDVCFVLAGQIVNRHLFAVRYQPSALLVVNSPIEAPILVEDVRKDWAQTDAESLKSSLLKDIHAGSYRTNPALARLRLYFPETYKTLTGSALKKKKEFERQEAEDSRGK